MPIGDLSGVIAAAVTPVGKSFESGIATGSVGMSHTC